MADHTNTVVEQLKELFHHCWQRRTVEDCTRKLQVIQAVAEKESIDLLQVTTREKWAELVQANDHCLLTAITQCVEYGKPATTITIEAEALVKQQWEDEKLPQSEEPVLEEAAA